MNSSSGDVVTNILYSTYSIITIAMHTVEIDEARKQLVPATVLLHTTTVLYTHCTVVYALAAVSVLLMLNKNATTRTLKRTPITSYYY